MNEFFSILKEWLPLINTLGIIAILLHYIKKMRGVHQDTTKLQDEHIDFLKSQTPAFMYQQIQAIKDSAQETISNLEKEKSEIEQKLLDSEKLFQEELHKAKLSDRDLRNLTQAKEDIEASSRAEGVTRLAHQIMLPLQALAIKIDEISTERDKNSDTARDLLSSIKKDLKRMALHIQTSQMLSGTFTPAIHEVQRFKIGILVQNTCELLSEISETKGSPIVINIDDDLSNTFINADYEKLQIILLNILENAIKHSFRGNSVELTVSRQDDYLTFKAVNIGIGIVPADEEKIFMRGYRGAIASEKLRTGAGMGLYLVNNLVKALHGNIQFESKRIEDTSWQIRFVVRILIFGASDENPMG